MNSILQHQFDHLLNLSSPFFHGFVAGQLQNTMRQDQHQHDHEFQQQSIGYIKFNCDELTKIGIYN